MLLYNLYKGIKASSEAQKDIDFRKDLLNQFRNGTINKSEYDLRIEEYNLELKQKEINKNKLTVGKAATGIVKHTTNAVWSLTGMGKLFK